MKHSTKNKKKKKSQPRISKEVEDQKELTESLSSTSVNDAVSASRGANEVGANHMKASVVPSAQIVGNAFVDQYYRVLFKSPDMVHRFYGANSVLSRPGAYGVMTSVTTMQEINEMILSSDYQDSHAEILTADAQESYQGGVVICVNGCLNGNNNVRRKFTQTFFLAPQEKGYFVLNDVFRYVDDVDLPTTNLTHSPDSIGVPHELAIDHTTSVEGETKENSKVSHALEDGRKELVSEKGLVAENHVDELVSEAAMSNLLEHASKKSSLSVLTDRESECTSHSFERELQDNTWNYAKVVASSKGTHSDLSKSVLESLFNFPKMPEDESRSMNWSFFVKQLQLLGPLFDVSPSSIVEQQQDIYAEGDECRVSRQNAKQHWDLVKSYSQKAAAAYAKGSRGYASYLSEQHEAQKKMAHNADERASMVKFKERNKNIVNEITIDLHGQRVKQAIRILKMHLLFGAYIQTVKILRVITGRGAHSQGKSELKQSVIKILKKESIRFEEKKGNPGIIVLELGEQTEFSFLDAESDTEEVP